MADKNTPIGQPDDSEGPFYSNGNVIMTHGSQPWPHRIVAIVSENDHAPQLVRLLNAGANARTAEFFDDTEKDAEDGSDQAEEIAQLKRDLADVKSYLVRQHGWLVRLSHMFDWDPTDIPEPSWGSE